MSTDEQFFDQDRVWTDFRPAIVWDLQKSINEELRARGQETHNDDAPVTPDMAAMLHLILSLSVNDGVRVNGPETMLEWLARAKERFVAELEANPSGRVQG